MTNCKKDPLLIPQQKNKDHTLFAFGVQRSLLALAAIFFMMLLLKNSHAAIAYTSEGLRLCAKTMIPSLFPFMVISDVILNLNIGNFCQRFTPKWLCKLLGTSPRELFIFVLGTLCGFPVGAKAAGKMYARGELDALELERVVTYSSNPSSAFVLGTVGVSLYGNQKIGLIIYACVIFAAFISMQLWRFFQKPRTTVSRAFVCDKAPARVDLTGAIGRSAKAMLSVCAFVVFFGTVTKILTTSIFTSLNLTPLTAFISGFFEISTGVKEAFKLTPGTYSICACAMICAWSGLSVHLQTISTLELETNGRVAISLTPYFLHKIIQSFIAGAICCVLCSFLL